METDLEDPAKVVQRPAAKRPAPKNARPWPMAAVPLREEELAKGMVERVPESPSVERESQPAAKERTPRGSHQSTPPVPT